MPAVRRPWLGQGDVYEDSLTLYMFVLVHAMVLAGTASALSEAPPPRRRKRTEKANQGISTDQPRRLGNAAAQREYFRNCGSEMQRAQKESGEPTR